MIVYSGDWIRRTGSNDWIEVVDIVDWMTVSLSDGTHCRADEDNIAELKSHLEYDKFINNFGE